SGTDPLGLFVPLVIAGYYISAEVVALASSGLAAVTAALSTPSGQQVVQNAANAISNTYYQIASQAMIENPGLIAFVTGQTATGRSLVDSGNAMADSYQSIFSDPCGAFASVFGDDNSTNPNVGKDLTDEEKNELGGAGSGSPNGWGPEDEQDARHREQHERYKDELRQQMEKPTVEDAELKNIIDDLYRPNAKVGSGSTADAVRYELSTGEKVGGRGHIQKAEQYSESLQRWLNKNPSASPGDRAAAENVLRDLRRALRGE
ncbi:Rhs family protein, partial [Salmonella enterica subsp. salamae serovar 58:l,z13,z28:z6 str. 00-0163]